MSVERSGRICPGPGSRVDRGLRAIYTKPLLPSKLRAWLGLPYLVSCYLGALLCSFLKHPCTTGKHCPSTRIHRCLHLPSPLKFLFLVRERASSPSIQHVQRRSAILAKSPFGLVDPASAQTFDRPRRGGSWGVSPLRDSWCRGR
jgi:hypothetical protein